MRRPLFMLFGAFCAFANLQPAQAGYDRCAVAGTPGCERFEATPSLAPRHWEGALVCVPYTYNGTGPKLTLYAMSVIDVHVPHEAKLAQLGGAAFTKAKFSEPSGQFCLPPETLARYRITGVFICDEFGVIGWVGPHDFAIAMRTGR